jgi:serine/threonine protein kinase
VTVAVVRQSDEPRAPRIVGGRWELLSQLAIGGMGTLYVGRHLQTSRRAAVKVIERASPEVMARFKLEASVSAQVNHPGIVEVFDADLDAVTGSCFIAMELLEGHTLRGVMDDPEATPREVLGHLMAALEPLVAAHECGFVHRDLKPENIFVREGKPRGVKLLDFGIVAQQSEQRLTRDGTAMGTPHYMSPEQATSAREAGPASDVWSMGVMMYEAIRGEVPFAGQTSHAVIIQACTCPHMPLDAVAPGVDPAIARLIDQCLEKDPAKRPQNARALLDALRDLLHPNSLPAARPSVRAPRTPEITDTSGSSGTRPSIRTRSIVTTSKLLAASGVVCGLSAIALPFAGVATPSAALLCAAVGGGLLFAASARLRSLKQLAIEPVAQQLPGATLVIENDNNESRPRKVEHPVRGPQGALVKIDLYADLSCAITRRACQRVLGLRLEHPEDIVVIYRPYWDPEREQARAVAEFARAIFEREGPDVFWEFFDRVIASTRKVTSDLLLQIASEAGAEMYGLRRALRSHAHRRSLQVCREDAEVSGVTESPTVLVNEGPLGGSITEDRLHWAYIDAKSARDRRRVVELGATRAGIETDAPPAVRSFLVRFRGARNAPPSLRRTREQAFERACKLVSRAQMPGSDFGEIALRFADNLYEHEDLTECLNNPLFADASRALQYGQLSEPLECDEGYQVLQRVS